jgi:hypothetical protein
MKDLTNAFGKEIKDLTRNLTDYDGYNNMVSLYNRDQTRNLMDYDGYNNLISLYSVKLI